MRLTLRGFLLTYCQQLAGTQTTSIKKLCAAAAHDAPRVAEPLFLYAVETSRLDTLLAQSTGTWMAREYEDMARIAVPYEGDALTFVESCDVSDRYLSVTHAFHARNGKTNADRRVIALMREKTNAALQARGLSAYRCAKDLGLNMGNVYAYLHKGNTAKVSRDTARRIMEYATA